MICRTDDIKGITCIKVYTDKNHQKVEREPLHSLQRFKTDKKTGHYKVRDFRPEVVMASLQYIFPLLFVLPFIAAWNPVLRSNDINSIRRAALLKHNEDSSDFGVYQRNGRDASDLQRAFSDYLKSSVGGSKSDWSDPCRLNLGGRCATEIASDLVKAWHYLNSANSPGRKRRDVREALRTILRHSAAVATAAADNRF